MKSLNILSVGSKQRTATQMILKNILDYYREVFFEEVQNWNEDELKLFFIGPVLSRDDRRSVRR